MPEFNFDNVKMNVVKTAANGVVNSNTLFSFHQSGDTVWAEYDGGGVTKGFLVGKVQGSSLKFRYCQTDINGNLDGGVSNCRLERMTDDRMRMIETFQWESRNETGENIFEELNAPISAG